MTTTKSSFKNRFFSVFKTSLKSQLPFAIVTGVLSILIITVAFFVYISEETRYMRLDTTMEFTRYFRDIFHCGVYIRAFQSGILTWFIGVITMASALVANSYMHSKKRTDLYHALPVTRTQLLLANLLASFTAIATPFLAVYLVTMGAQLTMYSRFNCFGPDYFLYSAVDIFSILVFIFVVYAFTTLVAVNVGTVFDSLAITAVTGFIPPTIYGIAGGLWVSFTYGATFDGEHALMLSPFLYTFQRYMYADYTYNGSSNYLYWPMLRVSLIWLAVGAALLAAAILCYRRRKSELAGQTQPQGIPQIVTMAFTAFCGAMVFCLIFSRTFLFFQLLMMLGGGFMVGVIAALIFGRGAKRLLKSMIWLGAGGVLACGLLLAVRFDITGYETYVPKTNSVASVRVSYLGRFEDLNRGYSSFYRYTADDYQSYYGSLTDPEAIDIVLNAHQGAVDARPNKGLGYWESYYYDTNYAGLSIQYKLKSGRTVTRYYGTMSADAYLLLADLEDKEEFIRGRHPVFLMDTLDGVEQTEVVRSLILNDAFLSKAGDEIIPPPADLRKLLDAIQEDMRNESLSEIHHPTSAAKGIIRINYADLADYYAGSTYSAYDVAADVLITPEYTRTMQVLQEIGYDSLLETPEMEQVYLLPAGYLDNYYKYRVTVMSTTNRDFSYYLDQNKDHTFTVSNQREIEEMTAHGIGQMLYEGDLENYVAMIPVINGEPAGFQYIHKDNLPSRAADWLRKEQNS